MNDQDLQVLQPKLHKLINYKSKGRQRQEKIARSLSGLFKELRNDRRVSNYGDYPIFRFILRECNLAVPHHRWSRAQMRRALAITEIPTEEGYKQVVIPPEFKVYMQNND